MHVKRCLALFFSLILAITGPATVSCVAADDEVDQTFKYAGPDAKTVGVAGEFSNWSVLPMTKDDSGTWSRTVHLKPGNYGYKLIVNGEWVLDPTNPARKKVNDIENSAVSVGGASPAAATPGPSVSGKIPTTFSFTDANAKSVHLAGEFNAWLDNVDGKVTGHSEWMLQNDGAGTWTLTVPLAPGKYKFKYVIDGGARWEKDRHLPPTQDDNSTIEVKAGGGSNGAATPGGSDGTTFTYSDTKAGTVQLAGDFNGWLDNVDGKVTGHSEWAMQNDGAGNWTLTRRIPAGKHAFKYVVDGGARWQTDPRLPTGTDGNSIIDIQAQAQAPVPAPVQPSTPAPTPADATPAPASTATPSTAQGATPTSFTYVDPAAKTVSIVGEFNQWSATANPMQKDSTGIWTATIPLKPGKYLYKLVVDGTWKADPLSPDGADDGFGAKNSVKVVAP